MIDDARVGAVIAMPLQGLPGTGTRWSTLAMAREAGLSQTAVSRIWRAFGLQPHLQDTFEFYNDLLSFALDISFTCTSHRPGRRGRPSGSIQEQQRQTQAFRVVHARR